MLQWGNLLEADELIEPMSVQRAALDNNHDCLLLVAAYHLRAVVNPDPMMAAFSASDETAAVCARGSWEGQPK